MNVTLSETIKRLRREKNLTQEDLADALGVSAQAVSKWETDVSCPDIALLPRLAVTLGVSMDTLFGMDEKSRELKLSEYIHRLDAEPDLDEHIKLTRAYLADMTDSVYLRSVLLRLYVEKGVNFTDARREEMRRHAHYILEHSTVAWQRTNAICHMIKVESDERSEDGSTPLHIWLNRLGNPQAITPADALIARYNYRGDVENYNEAIQWDIIHRLLKMFDQDFCKRDRVTYTNPASRVVGQRTILQIIDCLRDPTIEVDAWLYQRAFSHLRLAAGAFGMGDRDTGYAALDKAVELHLTYAGLPKDTHLTYNHPALDLIDLCVGDNAPSASSAILELHRCLTEPEGWEWFDAVREEERYRALVARVAEILHTLPKSTE